MDVQTVIDTALTASATTIGAAEAANVFRDTLRSSLKVRVNLKPNMQNQLRKMCHFPVVFTGGKTIANDHPMLVALRDLCRDIYEQEFHINGTTERTLVVSSGMREIRNYNANNNIHYYIHGKENKDYDRIIRPALRDIIASLKQKVKKTDRRVYCYPKDNEKAVQARPCVKRYWRMEEIFKDYVELNRLPSTIHTEIVQCNTLLFENSIYNFNKDQLCEIFEKSGAAIAYGYAMLPMELLFPDLPENDIYTFTTIAKKSCMTF